MHGPWWDVVVHGDRDAGHCFPDETIVFVVIDVVI
jgi:hypothetical protein